MNLLLGEKECEILTHSQQQSQAPNAHKKESTVRFTTRITMLCPPPPPKGLSFTGLRTQLKSSVRHTLSIQQAQLKEAETGSSNRKCTKTLSKAPCLVALNMYLTLHVLLFRQSM